MQNKTDKGTLLVSKSLPVVNLNSVNRSFPVTKTNGYVSNRGILSYRRRKTGQLLFIKWEKCMQEIVDKYNLPQSNYLLPIIKPMSKIDERKQYLYSSHKINRNLKILGEQLGLSIPLTMYVSRHAWASIAKSKNIPISIISEGLGHDSEATTRIYLASLDTIAIDKANRIILQSL